MANLKITIGKKTVVIGWLIVYFTTKMLWDQIPYIFELTSLAIIVFGTINYFLLKKWKTRSEDTYFFVIYILYMVYVILNALIQNDAKQFERAIYEYVFYSLIFFASAYFLVGIKSSAFWKSICFIGLIISLLSWYEYFTQSYLIGNFEQGYVSLIGSNVFRAAVFSRSYLSHGMMIGMYALISLYIYHKENKKIYLALCVFNYISIFTTSSRGPLVSCLVAMCLVFVCNKFKGKKVYKRQIIILLLFVLILAILTAIMFSDFTTSNSTIDYFLNRLRSVFNWKSDAGNVGRLVIWENTFNLFKTNIMFGIGPSKTGSWGAGSIGVTESGVLKRLCELGIVGFFFHYMLFAIVIVKGIRTYQRQDFDKKCDMMLYFGILAAILINDIILQSSEEIMVAFLMWFSLAGIGMYRCIETEKQIVKKKGDAI